MSPGTEEQADGSAGGPGPSRSRPGRAAVAGILVLFAAGFLLIGHQRLTMPFGDSHDGRNGAQWGLGSRALRRQGPLASHLGADLTAGSARRVYSDHPPLIYSETALAEAIAGERTWVTRAPAWIGALATIGLCYRLLRRCGIAAAPAAAGVALGLGCPMFGSYGMMNDPWIVGLPWGVALLLLWQRARDGDPAPTWLIGGIALVGALTSWVNVIEIALIVLAEAAAARRRTRPTVFLGATAGGALGVALTITWAAWSHGWSLDAVLHQATVRSTGGQDAITPSLVISYLRAYWSSTFAPWQIVLAVPVLVAAAIDGRCRPLLAVSLGTVAIWIVAFSDGAAHHDYWGYWLVVPLVVGFSAAGSALTRRVGARGGAALAGGALLVGLAGMATPSTVGHTLRAGSEGGSVLAHARLPASQTTVWYLGDIVQSPYWIAYPFDRPAARVRNLAALDRLAATAPDDVVLVAADRLTSDLVPTDPGAGCRAGVRAGHHFAVLAAGDLDRMLRAGPCRSVASTVSAPLPVSPVPLEPQDPTP